MCFSWRENFSKTSTKAVVATEIRLEFEVDSWGWLFLLLGTFLVSFLRVAKRKRIRICSHVCCYNFSIAAVTRRFFSGTCDVRKREGRWQGLKNLYTSRVFRACRHRGKAKAAPSHHTYRPPTYHPLPPHEINTSHHVPSADFSFTIPSHHNKRMAHPIPSKYHHNCA